MSEEKKKQVIALGQLGWSLRQIQKALGMRRETAGEYLKAAGVGVRPPGGWGKKAPSKPANGVTTDSSAEPAAETPPPMTAPAAAANVSEPFRELIENRLARGRNAMSIWQEMVDRHGFIGAYESVKRFVRKLRGPASPEARAVITTEPGQEAQVDYGSGPTIRDPHTGKYRRSRLFVLTLGYSRKCVRLLTFQSSTRIWAELHERAFRKLGGAVKIIVPDNLREGVLKPDIYDPSLNPPLPRCARSLRSGCHALPSRRSRSQRQSGKQRRTREENTTQGTALRTDTCPRCSESRVVRQ